MLAVPANRDSRPVGVLLGGSGLARMSTLRTPVGILANLLHKL